MSEVMKQSAQPNGI